MERSMGNLPKEVDVHGHILGLPAAGDRLRIVPTELPRGEFDRFDKFDKFDEFDKVGETWHLQLAVLLAGADRECQWIQVHLCAGISSGHACRHVYGHVRGHVYGHVRGHVCTQKPSGVDCKCPSIEAHLCTDMCTDMCVQTCAQTCK